MRRSSSTSNIPIARCSTARKRSNSHSRNSYLEPTTSLDRKSNLGLLKTTPKYGDKATPSSVSSRGSSASRFSRLSPGLSARKTIQQLCTNPTWISQEYAKVQCYIANSSIFDQTIINPNNIKPPNIKVFIHFMNTMFTLMFPSVNLTQENYMVEITNKLKLLHFPGNMTNSFLKSVNTMHNWPQVIGLFGWLIDKVSLTEYYKKKPELLSEEEKHRIMLTELVLNNFIATFPKGVENAVRDNPDERYIEDLKELLIFDSEEYEKNKDDYERKLKRLAEVKAEVETLSQENEELEHEKNELLSYIDSFQKNFTEEKVSKKAELIRLTEENENLEKVENEKLTNIAKLKEREKAHPCSYQQEIEKASSLEQEVAILKSKIEDIRELREKYNETIFKEREQLTSKVIEWNRSLKEDCLNIQYLKSLLLPEKSFHSEQFLEIIRALPAKIDKAENEIMKDIENFNKILKEKSPLVQTLKDELKIMEKQINEMMEQSKETTQKKAALDADTNQMLLDWEKEQKHFDELKSQNTEKAEEIKKLVENIIVAKERKDQIETEFKEFAANCIVFTNEMEKACDKDIQGMNLIYQSRVAKMEDSIKRQLEEAKEFITFLKDWNSPSPPN